MIDVVSFVSSGAGKAGMALVTTSNNHGGQVEQHLCELLQFTGPAR